MQHHRNRAALLTLALSAALTALGCGTGTPLTPDQSTGPAVGIQPKTTAGATPMGGGGLIAYTSDRAGNPEIYTLKLDGSEPTRMTYAEPAGKYFPKWSPKGDFLLFWTHTDEPPISDEYWLRSDGTTGLFANGAQPYVSFSPDGQTVVMCAPMEQGNIELLTVPVAGGASTRLTNSPGRDIMPAWSPDGKTIVFVSDRDGTLHLYAMDADGGNQRRLTDNEFQEAAPAWSPDGTRIAFFAGDSGNATNIFLVNADGSGTTNITNQNSGYNEDPSWSPDGQMLAFWSDRSGNHEIYVMRLDGSGLMNLTNSPTRDENPSWGP